MTYFVLLLCLLAFGNAQDSYEYSIEEQAKYPLPNFSGENDIVEDPVTVLPKTSGEYSIEEQARYPLPIFSGENEIEDETESHLSDFSQENDIEEDDFRGETRVKRNAVRDPRRHWPRGIVPFEIAPALRFLKKDILRAMKHIEKKTSNCVRFVPRTKKDRNHIYLENRKLCSSKIGRQGGSQIVGLGKGCKHAIVHELVHALGFSHEHKRPDRNSYVDIKWKNIRPGNDINFSIKKSSDVILGGPYDYRSIMHYPRFSDAMSIRKDKPIIVPKNPNQKIGSTGSLTPYDVKKIRNLYKCY